MLTRREKMLLEYYEEAIKELEELAINLESLSNNELRRSIRAITNRGWLQIETMFGGREEKKYTKEEIQKHFNEMLKVVPMTRIKNKK
tara:strand:+ start:325 stop:588 length:264 start_codon:yes stop_codon:yes gene_type:complete